MTPSMFPDAVFRHFVSSPTPGFLPTSHPCLPQINWWCRPFPETLILLVLIHPQSCCHPSWFHCLQGQSLASPCIILLSSHYLQLPSASLVTATISVWSAPWTVPQTFPLLSNSYLGPLTLPSPSSITCTPAYHKSVWYLLFPALTPRAPNAFSLFFF